ncbi:hypothetical protein Agub_g7374, partial [Astrephomene gubernaculifera]
GMGASGRAGTAGGVPVVEQQGQRQGQRQDDAFWQVHRWLYLCLLRARGLDQPSSRQSPATAAAAASSAAAALPSSLLCAALDATAELEEDGKVVLADLAVCPLRLRSWSALQSLYVDATRRLLQEAAVLLDPPAFSALLQQCLPNQQHQQHQQHQQQGPASAAVQALQGQGQGQGQQGQELVEAAQQLTWLFGMAVRSAVAAAQLDPDPESRCFRLEEIAVLHYGLVVPLHPLYDTLASFDERPTSAGAGVAVGALSGTARPPPATAVRTSNSSLLRNPMLGALSAAATAPPDALRLITGTAHEEGALTPATTTTQPGGGAVFVSHVAMCRRDWRYRAACQVAEDMWAAAAAVLDAEWQYEYWRGLVAAHRKAPGWRFRCMDHLAAAAVLAAADPQYGGGGLLAPLVALHGRRLRWLTKVKARAGAAAAARRGQEGRGGGGGSGVARTEVGEAEEEVQEQQRREVLEVCARYCFQGDLALRLHPGGDASSGLAALAAPLGPGRQPEQTAATAAAATPAAEGAAIESDDGATSLSVDQLEELLIADARQALVFAVRSYRPGKDQHHYHPARYLLAACELLLGRPEEADSQLRPLFTPARGRALFTLSMGHISDRGFGQQRRKAAAAAARAAEKQQQQAQQQQQQKELAQGGVSGDRQGSEGAPTATGVGAEKPQQEVGGTRRRSVRERMSLAASKRRRKEEEALEEEPSAKIPATAATSPPPSHNPGPRRAAATAAGAKALEAAGSALAGSASEAAAAADRAHGSGAAGLAGAGGQEEAADTGQEVGAGEERRGRSLPTALWGAEPAMVIGHGLEEDDREHITALRKCLGLYLRLLWERGDLTTLQAAVPVLYGALDKMPYLRDLACLALGLMATGAAAAACAAVGLPLEEAARQVQARAAAASGAGGSGGGPAGVRGAGAAQEHSSVAAQWLAAALEERMGELLAAAEAETAAAAAAAAIEAAAAAAAEKDRDSKDGDGGV